MGIGKFNKALYSLRQQTGLSQDAFGRLMGGYNGHTVNRIELGQSYGKLDFWIHIQQYFNIPDDQMWAYQTGTHIICEDN